MNPGKINLITPPDKLFNLNPSYLLIRPSLKVKMQFQQILSQTDEDLNVFIYDEDESNIDWLLSVSQQVDFIIIDIDNCDPISSMFISYLLAQPNTFYMTEEDMVPWNLISRNRIFNLDWIIDLINKSNEDLNDENDE